MFKYINTCTFLFTVVKTLVVRHPESFTMGYSYRETVRLMTLDFL